jgi:hypothetical protein
MADETLEQKDLAYYKSNAEEDYLHTPISVLRYITELEERMYSEQEVLAILHDYRNTFELYRNIQVLPHKFFPWFEQFKKNNNDK